MVRGGKNVFFFLGNKSSFGGQPNGSLCDGFSLVCIFINQHQILLYLLQNEQLLSV